MKDKDITEEIEKAVNSKNSKKQKEDISFKFKFDENLDLTKNFKIEEDGKPTEQ